MWRPVVSTSRNTLHLRSEGRNSLVGQDPIDVCHVQTYADKKVCRHMNLRARIRNVAKSPDKIAFSVSLRHQMTVLLTVKYISGLDLCSVCMSVQEGPTRCCTNTFPSQLLTSLFPAVPEKFEVVFGENNARKS